MCLCMWGMWGLEVMLGVFPNCSHLIFEAKSLTELILPIQGALGSPISKVMGTCYHAQLPWGAWRLNLSTSLMDSPAQCPVPWGWLPTEVLCRPFSRILGNLLIAQSACHSLALIRCDTQVPATLYFWNTVICECGAGPGQGAWSLSAISHFHVTTTLHSIWEALACQGSAISSNPNRCVCRGSA